MNISDQVDLLVNLIFTNCIIQALWCISCFTLVQLVYWWFQDLEKRKKNFLTASDSSASPIHNGFYSTWNGSWYKGQSSVLKTSFYFNSSFSKWLGTHYHSQPIHTSRNALVWFIKFFIIRKVHLISQTKFAVQSQEKTPPFAVSEKSDLLSFESSSHCVFYQGLSSRVQKMRQALWRSWWHLALVPLYAAETEPAPDQCVVSPAAQEHCSIRRKDNSCSINMLHAI